MEQEQAEELNLKNLEIVGTLQVPKGVTEDQISMKFIEWCESNGYYFAGAIQIVE